MNDTTLETKLKWLRTKWRLNPSKRKEIEKEAQLLKELGVSPLIGEDIVESAKKIFEVE